MKILFTDLDGTLLDNDKQISAGNREAINKMLSLGHKIVISTGRPLPSGIKIAKQLGLEDSCYIIAYNGAQIYDSINKKILFSKNVPLEQMRRAFDLAKKYNLHIHTYDDSSVITPIDDEITRYYCSRLGINMAVIPDIAQTKTTEPPKLLVVDMKDFDKLKAYQAELMAENTGKISTFFSCNEYLEIVGTGISKGFAVEFLCDVLKVPIEDSIAAGDAENDLPMIKCAGLGVVMANGEEEMKKDAGYVTKNDNNHDGIAEIIYKFVI